MEKKQNSVEWLIRIVQSCIAPNYIPQEIIKQAKAMHKEEIIRAYQQGDKDGANYEEFLNEFEVYGSRYYTKTFGGDNE